MGRFATCWDGAIFTAEVGDWDGCGRGNYFSQELGNKSLSKAHLPNVLYHAGTIEAAGYRCDGERDDQRNETIVVINVSKRPSRQENDKGKQKTSQNAQREGSVQVGFRDAL